MPRPDFINTKLKIAEIIRVNHAGEYGAKRIYEGQIKFANNVQDKILYSNMLVQEQKHLDYFAKELVARKVRPTILIPLWHIGGYVLGGLSSIVGMKFAMLVTQNVEEVIEKHYQQQLADLLIDAKEEQDLITHIEQFKDEEVEHKEVAISFQHGSYNTINNIIKRICIIAIYLSKKI